MSGIKSRNTGIHQVRSREVVIYACHGAIASTGVGPVVAGGDGGKDAGRKRVKGEAGVGSRGAVEKAHGCVESHGYQGNGHGEDHLFTCGRKCLLSGSGKLKPL